MHIEDLRLEAARRQLESAAASLEEVAMFSGFKSAEVLRRVFARRLNTIRDNIASHSDAGSTIMQRLEQSHQKASSLLSVKANSDYYELPSPFQQELSYARGPRSDQSRGRKHPEPLVFSHPLQQVSANRPVGLISGDIIQVNRFQRCQARFGSLGFGYGRGISSSRAERR